MLARSKFFPGKVGAENGMQFVLPEHYRLGIRVELSIEHNYLQVHFAPSPTLADLVPFLSPLDT